MSSDYTTEVIVFQIEEEDQPPPHPNQIHRILVLGDKYFHRKLKDPLFPTSRSILQLWPTPH